MPDALQRVGNFSENLPTTAPQLDSAHAPRSCPLRIARVQTMAENFSSVIQSRTSRCRAIVLTLIRISSRTRSPPRCCPRMCPCPRRTVLLPTIASSPTGSAEYIERISDQGRFPVDTDIIDSLEVFPIVRLPDHIANRKQPAGMGAFQLRYRQQNANVSDVWTVSSSR